MTAFCNNKYPFGSSRLREFHYIKHIFIQDPSGLLSSI